MDQDIISSLLQSAKSPKFEARRFSADTKQVVASGSSIRTVTRVNQNLRVKVRSGRFTQGGLRSEPSPSTKYHMAGPVAVMLHWGAVIWRAAPTVDPGIATPSAGIGFRAMKHESFFGAYSDVTLSPNTPVEVDVRPDIIM